MNILSKEKKYLCSIVLLYYLCYNRITIKRKDDMMFAQVQCDYCHQPIPDGEDIYLEGWYKDLACSHCCEHYSLLEKWINEFSTI